ncbi:hypothetical protein E0W80_04525 [Microbacterium sp. PI-1]|uniref:hypothetical protein n=1 Tax=Microbacterium sp. PI-1 TaxID=2545631 RepID=UPI00103984E2|nr:hypothetical protein [Microbacterium sp. PI-1]TCJ28770.1 hypothetical protein E0W80_04525 [Microbacterium sp. PI-1]
MTLTKTFPTQDPAGLSITDTRRVMAGLVTRNADGTPRPGVFLASDAPIVTGRASMGYNVAAFLAALSRINNGIELIANDASMIVATTASPASNSRIDVIWARARFVQHADGSNLPEIGVTQGVAAAIPSKPSIPAGAFELATAEIPSSATTTLSSGVVITQTYQCTVAAGGVVPFRNASLLNAWSNPAPRQRAIALDTGTLYQHDGSAWVDASSGMTLIRTVAANSGTSLILDNVFSPRFRNYRILADFTLAAATALNAAFRANGADLATNNYTLNRSWDSSATARATSIVTTSGMTLSGVAATRHRLALDIFGPSSGDVTMLGGKDHASGGSPALVTTDVAAQFGLTTLLDGIRFNPGQTINAASVSVYGCS